MLGGELARAASTVPRGAVRLEAEAAIGLDSVVTLARGLGTEGTAENRLRPGLACRTPARVGKGQEQSPTACLVPRLGSRWGGQEPLPGPGAGAPGLQARGSAQPDLRGCWAGGLGGRAVSPDPSQTSRRPLAGDSASLAATRPESGLQTLQDAQVTGADAAAVTPRGCPGAHKGSGRTRSTRVRAGLS